MQYRSYSIMGDIHARNCKSIDWNDCGNSHNDHIERDLFHNHIVHCGLFRGSIVVRWKLPRCSNHSSCIDHTWINARRIIRTAQLNLKTIRKLSVKTLRISFFRFCDELIPFDCVLDAFAEQQFTELFC